MMESTPKAPIRRLLSAHPWRWLGALVVLAGAGWVAWRLDVDWRELGQALTELNRPLLLLALAILPVFGFPVSVTYFAAGAVFGPWYGGLVVGGATAGHLLLTHLLATTVLRRLIIRGQQGWRDRLPVVPPGEKAALLTLLVIVPGPPYVARNALMILGGVPLRLRLALGTPLYVVRAYVTLMAGTLLQHPDPAALALTGGVLVLKLTVGFLLFRRLRRRCLPPPRAVHA